MTHPTPAQLAGYRRQTLSPEERLALDDHLATCGGCRESLVSTAQLTQGVQRMARELLDPTLEAGPGEHPIVERLVALQDGRIDPIEREILEEHLEDCATCAQRARERAADHASGLGVRR